MTPKADLLALAERTYMARRQRWPRGRKTVPAMIHICRQCNKGADHPNGIKHLPGCGFRARAAMVEDTE